ncbi:MAG: hypothetical protein Q9185_002666 [Variospora sp. 1 TL-2023]
MSRRANHTHAPHNRPPKRASSSSPGNSQRQSLPKHPFYGLLDGAEKFGFSLSSIPTLNAFLTTEWPLWMRQFSAYRVHRSPLNFKFVELFNKYSEVRNTSLADDPNL